MSTATTEKVVDTTAALATWKQIQMWIIVVLLVIMTVVTFDFFVTPIWAEVLDWEDVPRIGGFTDGAIFFSALIAILLVATATFTVVRTGRAKLVEFLGEYTATLAVKTGHKALADGEIVPLDPGEESAPKLLPGGLFFVGFYPIWKIASFSLKWVDKDMKSRSEAGEDEIKILDYPYGIVLESAEDANGITTTTNLIVTAYSNNPRKQMYETNDFYESFTGIIKDGTRQLIASQAIKKLQSSELAKTIMEELKKRGALAKLANLYGLTVRSIQVVNLDPGDEFRAFTVAEFKGESEARQAIQETAGRNIASVALELGYEDVKALQQAIKLDPTIKTSQEYKDALQNARDLTKRDRSDVSEIRVGNPDGTPFEDAGVGGLIGGLAAWLGAKGAGQGRKGKKNRQNQGGGGGKNPPKNKPKLTDPFADDDD